MRELQGLLSAVDLSAVTEKTAIRFKNFRDFKDAESLIVFEQNMSISQATLTHICSKEQGVVLETPAISYISKTIIDEFRGMDCAPLSYDVATNTIRVATICEFSDKVVMCKNYNITKVLVPMFYYVNIFTKLYGEPDFLLALPQKDKLDFIINEAIQLEASDITITNIADGTSIYYNVRKRKVMSRRNLSKDDVKEIAKLLATSAKATLDEKDRNPRFLSVRLDIHNRGRVTINRTYYGYGITIRVLPDEILDKKLEDLNLSADTCSFIRDVVLSKEKGLRLFIGETMSGKNTTILASLLELVNLGIHKIVSIEQPVEILVNGIEQIDCETDDEFTKNTDSLLRQNPDIVYFTEITSRTAENILITANTSKAVFSSIHANSISDVLFRLQDLTQMSIDRILLCLQSCIFQELVRDEDNDRIYPVNRYIHFDDNLKMELYGKDISYIKDKLSKLEEETSCINQ